MDEAQLLDALDATINEDPTLEELDEEINKESIEDVAPTIQPEGPVYTSSSSSSSSRNIRCDPLATDSNRVEEKTYKGAKTSIPLPGDVTPGDPKWEVIGDRVIRKYKGSNRPAGIWPEVWQLTPHKERLRLIKEAKEFNEANTNVVPTKAVPEGIPPMDTGTGEGCWPGAPAARPIMPKKEVVRHIVEFCTSENSKMGDQRYIKNGCTVLRCSLKDDVTTNKGLRRALDGVRRPHCLLWASMPCIGGSPWQHINRHKPGGLERLDAHIKEWYKIWTAFKAVARECIKYNGHIAVEWPSGCDYWKYHIVIKFFEELQLTKIRFDGCALGLRSDHDCPIKKPWSIATNNGHIYRAFSKYSCPGSIKHPHHEPCAGKYTKRSEGYTWPFTDVLHKAWRDSQIEIQRGVESTEARYFRKLNEDNSLHAMYSVRCR